MQNKILVLSLMILPFLPVHPWAAANDAFFGMGPRVGFYSTEENGNDELDGYLGVQMRFRFNSVFGIEASFDWREDEYTIVTPYEETKMTVEHHPVLVSAMFDLVPFSSVSPYVLMGIGWYYMEEKYEGYDYYYETDDRDFGYHLGGGINAYFNPNMCFNADLRYNFLKITEDEWGDSELDAGGWIVNMGLTFFF